MIIAPKHYLVRRCIERGYTLDEVMPCVVAQDGDRWTVDVNHPAYPREPKPSRSAAAPQRGPGTELKKLLAGWPFRIVASSTCRCNAMVRQMDAWGPDECSRPERVAQVLAVMRENAAKRGLVFFDALGRLLIREAIRRARRATAAA
jgi:hypothetical protein